MKILKIILATIFVAGLLAPSIGCSPEPDGTGLAENQEVTVQRGNLVIDVTAVGNLALSRTEDLAFEVAGTVEEVIFVEGDNVETGQVVASLDTASLEEAVKTKERALQTAELSVRTSELALQTSEGSVQTAETSLKSGEISVRSAEIDLEQARNDYQKLITPYPYITYQFVLPESVSSIAIALGIIKDAQDENQKGLEGEEYSLGEVKEKLMEAQEILKETKTELAWGLGSGTQPTGIEYWTLRASQIKVEKALLSLETALNNLDKLTDSLNTAKNNLDKANINLDIANINLDIAKDDLDTAKDELEKAVIIAPFDGFITLVNVEGGDEVLKGTVAVQLVDPDKFEAEVMVSEMDILQINLGGEAWVQVDAMQGLSLPAEVTHISPTATIQSGVVNYTVKVEIKSFEAVMREGQEAMQEAKEKLMEGELPESLKIAIEEGQITQEQAEEKLKQMQQGQGGKQGHVPTATPEEFQLREGLTVTVSIIVDERTDVLLVPNAAITPKGQQTYVQVLSPDGTIEERAITTGISDWQYTEVTEGLSEGEKVIAPQGTASTPTTTQKGGTTIRIPGMGPH
ncbi:efflux RND transporter periplasmic adaptor subunit [Chloroflexota bacterium]